MMTYFMRKYLSICLWEVGGLLYNTVYHIYNIMFTTMWRVSFGREEVNFQVTKNRGREILVYFGFLIGFDEDCLS